MNTIDFRSKVQPAKFQRNVNASHQIYAKWKLRNCVLSFCLHFFLRRIFFCYCSPSQFSLPLLSWAAPTKRNSFVVMKKKFNFLIYIGDSFAHPLTKIIKLFYLDGRSHATCLHFLTVEVSVYEKKIIYPKQYMIRSLV